MWHEIAAWQETLTQRPDLAAKTIALYTQDVRRFATWLQSEHSGLKATEVTPNIHLSVVTLGQQLHRHLTPLSELQKHILSLWDLSPALYDQLSGAFLDPT